MGVTSDGFDERADQRIRRSIPKQDQTKTKRVMACERNRASQIDENR